MLDASEGDHRAHVTVRTQDEIGQLCIAFNGMVDEIVAQNTIIEQKNRENEELLLNVLPAPGLLSTWIVRPIVSISSLTIASPTPVPPKERVGLLST